MVEHSHDTLLPADDVNLEIQRLRLAYKRLAEMFLEFGVGSVGIREHAIRSIFDSSLEALRDMDGIQWWICEPTGTAVGIMDEIKGDLARVEGSK
ncbi:MAG: hypothetical protein WC356_04765 [Candidatus Micrarchaeia archaeon]|jgi:hypothetical protein